MKNKLLILLCLIIIGHHFSFAQTNDSTRIRRSSIYLELGGNAFFYSINYDYIVLHQGILKAALGTGLSYIPRTGGWDVFGNVLFISPNANFLIGREHNLELGSGVTFSLDNRLAIPVRIGYRYQPKKGGLLFRIAFTPLFSDFIYPIGGLSIGYTIE